MPANNPNSPNAATIQGPGPTGNEGYPVAVVPATGSDPFPVTFVIPPGSTIIVSDIQDGAGNSIMNAALDAAKVEIVNTSPIPVVLSGSAGGATITFNNVLAQAVIDFSARGWLEELWLKLDRIEKRMFDEG
jgi:hypothetical protein